MPCSAAQPSFIAVAPQQYRVDDGIPGMKVPPRDCLIMIG
jgi:hypothetical protein